MKITEKNFVLEMKKKNERALEYVLDNYGWIIKSIVKKNLYNMKIHEEECVNDILLGIWNNIDSFDDEKNTFKNWAAAVSKYKTIDYRRKYLKDLKNENIDNVQIPVKDDGLREVMKNELDEQLNDMLSCLKNEDKKLFLDLYVKEKEIVSISKETGLKRDVIYNRISRGKRKIKNMFKSMESRG